MSDPTIYDTSFNFKNTKKMQNWESCIFFKQTYTHILLWKVFFSTQIMISPLVPMIILLKKSSIIFFLKQF